MTVSKIDSAYTAPEDEAMFAAIGRMTASWSMLEAGST